MQASITSVGIVSAVGLTAESTAAAVRAGIAGFALLDDVVDMRGDHPVAARVPRSIQQQTLARSMARMAVGAAEQALGGRQGISSTSQIPIVIAIPSVRPGIGQRFKADLATSFDSLTGGRLQINGSPVWIEGSHCAGMRAISAGMEVLRSGAVSSVLVGAVDSYVVPETLVWLDKVGKLHGAANPWGFIPGEAAAFMLLQNEARIDRTDGVRPLRIDACLSADLPQPDNAIDGIALGAVINHVLDALPQDHMVGDIWCDLNGQRSRAKEYAFAMPKFAHMCRDAIDFRISADCIGDVGAASGPVLAALAFEAARNGYANGKYQLVWTQSETGESAALLTHMAS